MAEISISAGVLYERLQLDVVQQITIFIIIYIFIHLQFFLSFQFLFPANNLFT